MTLSSAGVRLSDWFERWFPDPFVFAAAAVAVVYAASIAAGSSPIQSAAWFGQGFWELVKFTMQMAMIVVSGFAVATSHPVERLIRRLAAVPKTGKGAAAFVAAFAMLSSLLSWSFSLIFSGLLAREVAKKVKGADYRALGAAAYMGLGSVWALGLSSSAALIMAAPGSMPPALLKISGVVPLTQTLLLWQNLLMAAVLLVASVAIAWLSAPDHSDFPRPTGEVPAGSAGGVGASRHRPGEFFEHSPLLSLFLSALGVAYLGSTVAAKGWTELLDLNNYIFLFLVLGLLLHWRPASFIKAVGRSVPATAGILIQYPLYAGILKILTESGLASRLAHVFVEVSTQTTYPLLVSVYSGILGLFVPSAGGKWLIEAPYLMEAAKSLGVHAGWTVQVYNAAEALPNLVHPFWMLPLLGILELRARDIVGYTAIQFLIHVPLVLLLVYSLNLTF